MGQLNTSLVNAGKLIAAIQKSIEKFTKEMNSVRKELGAWSKSAVAAMDELYLYVAEKVKKKGLVYKAVENTTVGEYTDSNVERYLSASNELVTKSSEISASYTNVLGSIGGDVGRLQTLLTDIEAKLKKKKKKLLQSKKYKSKLALYEAALRELNQKCEAIAAKSAEFQGVDYKLPSPAQIKRNSHIAADTTLKVLNQKKSEDIRKQYTEFSSLVLKLDQTTSQLREEAEFAQNMKMLQEMIAEADNMEKEGD